MKISFSSLLLIALSAQFSSAFLLKDTQKKPDSSLAQKLIPSLARKQQIDGDRDGVRMLAKEKPTAEFSPETAKEKLKKSPSSLKRPAGGHVSGDGAFAAPSPAPAQGCIACEGEQIVYGKYRRLDGDQMDNSYYLFKNPAHLVVNGPLPVIIHFQAGGFLAGEPWTQENDEIKAFLTKGFAVVSVGARVVTTKYIFESKDTRVSQGNKTEELIHIAKDGKLSLDSSGRTMEDYKVRVGKQELITKFLYDATQMIEHLIDNAEDMGLDVNRIVFAGESLGGAAIQYLTWVYHKWNVERYTPRGMVYHNAQLNYPVENMLGETWDLFLETMGPKVKLADIVSAEACPTIIGNSMCGTETSEVVSDYNLCNEEWNEKTMDQFCGDEMKSKTLEQVRSHQVWPREDKEVGRGMEKLWYASENMQQHKPSDPFFIYVANSMNGTGIEDISKHSVYALNFAKFAEMGEHGGHQYTVYYTDFANMNEEDRGMERFEVSRVKDALDLADALPPPVHAPGAAPAASAFRAPHIIGSMPWPAPAPAPAPAVEEERLTFNYLSTHGWREDLGTDGLDAGSVEERVLYACLAAGIGPFKDFQLANETDKKRMESGAFESHLPGFALVVASLVLLLKK